MATAKKKTAPAKPKQRARSAPRAAVKSVAASKRVAKPEVAQKVSKTGARTRPEAKVLAPAPKVTAPAKRVRTDWDAVHRDYRTGKFTLRELEAKHGADNGLISRKAKRDGWTQDLSLAIKQATNAKLIEELVSKEVSSGQQKVSNTVLAAADLNKQVILSHRQDIARARNLANAMLNELHEVTVNPAKLRDLLEVLVGGEDMTAAQIADARTAFTDLSRLPTRILSVQRLSQAMTRLQSLERTAFGLDEPEQPPPVDDAADLSDEELDARIQAKVERLNSR